MFDQKITPVATTVVAATQPQLPNSADRKGVLYIEDMYDPDVVSDSDASKYIVPFIGQLVIDVKNRVIYSVKSVANQSAKYKPTLEIWTKLGGDSSTSNVTKILGASGGFRGEAILGIDYSVNPPKAVVDGRVWCPGAAYAYLYKGDVIGENGEVISAQYNSGLDLVQYEVPMVLAAMDGLTNSTIMVCGPCSVTLNADELPDGSSATIVFFDAAGNSLRNSQILSVQHTALLRDHRIGIKYVESIELVAPWFMDTVDPNTLNIPINVAIKTVQFRLRVNYSNGEFKIITIDGKKAALLGINQYRPTSVGEKETLVATYTLGDDEQALRAEAGAVNQKRKAYSIIASKVDGTYTPKIYTYPYWDGAGWKLRHFMYDLERGVGIDVTQYVVLNNQSPTFDPNGYGIEQSLIFNLTLSDISPSFKAWTHIQYTTIVLYQSANKQGRHWDVRYTYLGTPYVGFNVLGETTNGKFRVSLGGSYPNVDAWLNRVYTLVQPLVNPYTETAAPKPNIVEFMTMNGNKKRIAVNDWSKPIELDEKIDEGQTAFLRWIKQDQNGNELQLAITGVSVSANPTNDSADNGTVNIVEGYLTDSEFTLDKDEVLSGGVVNASAIARDIAGKLMPNVAVAFTASNAYPVTEMTGGNGMATAAIELNVTGERFIVASTSKGQTKAKKVMVVSGSAILKPNSLVLSKDSVVAGKESYTVKAMAADDAGNPLKNISINYRVVGANPLTGSVTTGEDGYGEFEITPVNAGNDTITLKIITGSTLTASVAVTDA